MTETTTPAGERYWLDVVLERNAKEFKKLPRSIREADFSHDRKDAK